MDYLSTSQDYFVHYSAIQSQAGECPVYFPVRINPSYHKSWNQLIQRKNVNLKNHIPRGYSYYSLNILRSSLFDPFLMATAQGGFRSLADGEEVEFDVEEDTKSGSWDRQTLQRDTARWKDMPLLMGKS